MFLAFFLFALVSFTSASFAGSDIPKTDISKGNGAKAGQGGVFLSEDFGNLDGWVPFPLFKGKKCTIYTPAVENGRKCLKAQSDCSASALALNRQFDVYKYPVLRWKWKITAVYPNGDIEKNKFNDAPARLYVLFRYNPKKAGFFTRLKYSIAKKIYGMYPPQSGLCYVWADKPYKKNILTSPAWDRSKNIVLEAGATHLNEWREERVNILDDYREAFGKDPPHMAVLAIMDSSQNTCGQSVSYFGDLEITSGKGQVASNK